MESQPQNPEFRNNPENFHPCLLKSIISKLATCKLSINLTSLHCSAGRVESHFVTNSEDRFSRNEAIIILESCSGT